MLMEYYIRIVFPFYFPAEAAGIAITGTILEVISFGAFLFPIFGSTVIYPAEHEMLEKSLRYWHSSPSGKYKR